MVDPYTSTPYPFNFIQFSQSLSTQVNRSISSSCYLRNRRKKSAAVPNPKRMFEEANMVRRVKAYLNNMNVITDEDRLHAMSMECEPPVGGFAPAPSTTAATNAAAAATSNAANGTPASNSGNANQQSVSESGGKRFIQWRSL